MAKPTTDILLRLPPEVAAALNAEVGDLGMIRNTYIVRALSDLLADRLEAMRAEDGTVADTVPLFDVDQAAQ